MTKISDTHNHHSVHGYQFFRELFLRAKTSLQQQITERQHEIPTGPQLQTRKEIQHVLDLIDLIEVGDLWRIRMKSEVVDIFGREDIVSVIK